eukprot:CAMPEP_0172761964 /NCGR_PEP_ID=MMETSP1074-20121228/172542_1 /TAXON_ID=2916 /ORGANISM="Ceratium fusus, Strain PA161109" /LENGTH=153 /DNA_ID=CAMNT_0013596269 /DNA_START=186 /DNA_END=648 /DNA_ORIENTATION=-
MWRTYDGEMKSASRPPSGFWRNTGCNTSGASACCPLENSGRGTPPLWAMLWAANTLQHGHVMLLAARQQQQRRPQTTYHHEAREEHQLRREESGPQAAADRSCLNAKSPAPWADDLSPSPCRCPRLQSALLQALVHRIRRHNGGRLFASTPVV